MIHATSSDAAKDWLKRHGMSCAGAAGGSADSSARGGRRDRRIYEELADDLRRSFVNWCGSDAAESMAVIQKIGW